LWIPSCHLTVGSNTGIGKATAIFLARRGARVILACRNKQRGEVAETEVKEVKAHSYANVSYLLVMMMMMQVFDGKLSTCVTLGEQEP